LRLTHGSFGCGSLGVELSLVESSGRGREFLAGGGGERRLDDSIRIDLGSSEVGLEGLDLVTSFQDTDSHHGEKVVSGVGVVVWRGEEENEKSATVRTRSRRDQRKES